MNQDAPRGRQPLYTQIDVTPPSYNAASSPARPDTEHTRLLRDLLAAQDRQNELLEELVGHLGAANKQRSMELGQWKQANPRLAKNCRFAAETLGRVQTEFLESLTQEIADNADSLMEGEYMLNDFIDRFGPRMAHLNGILQVLSQLSASPNAPMA